MPVDRCTWHEEWGTVRSQQRAIGRVIARQGPNRLGCTHTRTHTHTSYRVFPVWVPPKLRYRSTNQMTAHLHAFSTWGDLRPVGCGGSRLPLTHRKTRGILALGPSGGLPAAPAAGGWAWRASRRLSRAPRKASWRLFCLPNRLPRAPKEGFLAAFLTAQRASWCLKLDKTCWSEPLCCMSTLLI